MSATKCGGRGKHYCQGAAKSTHCHKKNPRSPQWSAHGHCRKLHTQGLDGYRGPCVQHREATDMGSRLDICHWTKAKPQMTHDILFTDEIPFIAIGPYILYKELPYVTVVFNMVLPEVNTNISFLKRVVCCLWGPAHWEIQLPTKSDV